jgi:hypothetical protein
MGTSRGHPKHQAHIEALQRCCLAGAARCLGSHSSPSLKIPTLTSGTVYFCQGRSKPKLTAHPNPETTQSPSPSSQPALRSQRSTIDWRLLHPGDDSQPVASFEAVGRPKRTARFRYSGPLSSLRSGGLHTHGNKERDWLQDHHMRDCTRAFPLRGWLPQRLRSNSSLRPSACV